MARLKIGAIANDTPVKLTVVLPAAVHRDLVSYADALSKENGQAIEPPQLVAPMLTKFMATDRAFAKWRHSRKSANGGAPMEHHASGRRGGDSIDR